VLPASTETAWTALRSRRELGGFTLVGGTALALRIRHRISEDLDFAWPELRLPATRIRLALEATRIPYESHDNPAAALEFADSGLELHDYQQDYLVAGAKVSFFAVDSQLARVLSSETSDTPRIASLQEIFASKCLASAQRSRSRDWYDLYVLIRDHGFSLRDYLAAFETAGDRLACEGGLTRLCSGKPDQADEGFHALVENAPPIAELAAFFRARRDELEMSLAAERLAKDRKT